MSVSSMLQSIQEMEDFEATSMVESGEGRRSSVSSVRVSVVCS